MIQTTIATLRSQASARSFLFSAQLNSLFTTLHCLTMFNVILGATLLFSSTYGKWVEPWFCHDLNCPIYSNPKNITVNKKLIEIRIYEQASWASTLVENTELSITTIYKYPSHI